MQNFGCIHPAELSDSVLFSNANLSLTSLPSTTQPIKQVKTVVTTAPKPSFFHYFGEPMTEEEEEEEAENEDEEAPRIRLSQEEDYDIGKSEFLQCIVYV